MISSNKFLLRSFILCGLIAIAGCSSAEPETVGDQDVLSEIQEAQSDAPAAADSKAVDDFAGDDFAADEKAVDEFSDNPVAEPAQSDAVAQDNAADPFADEEAFVDEEAFTEEPIADENTEGSDSLSDALAVEDASPVMSGPKIDVTSINFTQNAKGGSILVKSNGAPNYTTRYNAETNQFVIEIQNATLRDSLKRPYIMKDFESDFGTINAYQNEGGNVARIVIQMKEPGEPVVQKEGNQLIVLPSQGEIPKVAAKVEEKKPDEQSYDVASAEKEEKVLGARTLDEYLQGSMKFFGRPISIQVSDAAIQDVINFIADESGVNIVLAEDVSGKITLKLRQVPWDQALVIVMRAKGLGYIRQGNVLRITKLETLQAETNAAKAIVDAQANLTPVRVKVIPVSYAAVNDLATQIKPFLSPTRGQVVADPRTSSLIITDTGTVLDRVERLVRELDLPPTQVMIEGKIVEASETFSRTLGVNWNYSGAPLEISGKGGFQGNPINMSTNFNTNGIPASSTLSSAFNINVGTIDFFGNLSARLGLAQSDSLAKVISSPRIVTMNRTEAEISQQGEVISISSITDQSGKQTTTAIRTPVQLKLTVTPQITSEGSVILEVNVQRQFAGAVAEATTQARPVNTRAAKTKVLVPNGQTAVIGGIYQNDETTLEQGVPVLKDIPVLGWLFKGKQTDRAKNELLIFLTPRILNPQEQSVTN